MRRILPLVFLLALAGLVKPVSSRAAQLVARGAVGVRLAVNAKGEALLTYRKGSAVKHVLAWGAVNALAPEPGAEQERFRLDYAGGWGKYHATYWKTFGSRCGPYDGPPLPDLVAACKAPDGSYWAAQSWSQALPDLGYAPWLPGMRVERLELSHWSGPVAKLTVGQDWVYHGRFQQLFGRYTYAGAPVYGFGSTRTGAPTDGFGRLIYLDTYDSSYGHGWRRENAFLPHPVTGVFCYGFYPHDPTKGGYRYPPGRIARRGPGTGTKYRLFAEGPGVTPDVSVVVPALHPFDPSNRQDVELEQRATRVLAAYGDTGCRVG